MKKKTKTSIRRLFLIISLAVLSTFTTRVSAIYYPTIPEEFTVELKKFWVAGFQLMTEQLHATMMQQTQIIGSFLDARNQMETQRLFQKKVAEAHKDYHPSEEICMVGTFARDLALTERHGDLAKTAMANKIIQRQLSSGWSSTVGGERSDIFGRINTFIDNNCKIEDDHSGLKNLCDGTAATDERQDRDINYTRLIDMPLTLDVNFTDNTVTEDETDLFSMMNYLFMHKPFPHISETVVPLNRAVTPMQNMRSIIAMRQVAVNSIANIIGQKASGPANTPDSTTPFVRALLRDFGLNDTEITEMLGEHPSYYAQMEILTKKIYQHPNFISELYDKPANVKRMRAAMMAIKLMQDRDIHEALMRREMLLSMISEVLIRNEQELVYDNLRDQMFRHK